MKIAGRKNDGAWYRANKFIKAASPGVKSLLSAAIAESLFIDNAYNALVALQTKALGSTATTGGYGLPDTAAEWAATLGTVGIPRQVWFGKLSWTTYSEDGAGFHPDGASEMHYFGKDLRKIVRNVMLGTRQMYDIANLATRQQGNVGGKADATKGN